MWIFKLPDPASDTLDMRIYLQENLTYFPVSNNENLSQQGGGVFTQADCQEKTYKRVGGWHLGKLGATHVVWGFCDPLGRI